MSSVNVNATVEALLYSARNMTFGEIVLATHKRPLFLPRQITFRYTSRTKDIDEWSYKIIYELHRFVRTEFALLVHPDGFVVNPDQWSPEFLKYDYIGSPFPLPTDDYSYRDPQGNLIRVGNSVSIRSKRLLELPTKIGLPWEPYHGFYNEDGFLCCKNKLILENHGISFAPLDVAKYFGHENMIPEIQGIRPFVFHKWAGTNAQYPKFSNSHLKYIGRRLQEALIPNFAQRSS
jgi:hypothetical protein